MAFVERQLRFTFSRPKTSAADFSSGAPANSAVEAALGDGAADAFAPIGTLSVAGLRAVVNVQAFPERLSNSAQVRIWGLSMGQMNTYSSRLAGAAGIDRFNLVIEAGDIGGALSTVVNGAIWRSYIDLTEAPESSFNVTVAGTVYTAANPMAAQSQAGAQNAEDLISSICAGASLTLHNRGAHAVLRNHATYGSAIDQIEDIARAAGFTYFIEGNTVTIWPLGGVKDEVVIDVGPDTGMVGYPSYWEAGLIVRSLFNQDIQIGRQMRITSSIPKANGLWQIIQVNHDLATMMRGGPWFTTAVLSAPGGP